MQSVFTPDLSRCLRMFHAVGKAIYFAHVTITAPSGSQQTQKNGLPAQCRHHKDPDVNYAWCCVCSSPGFVMDRFGKAFFEALDTVTGTVACEILFRMAHELGRSLFGKPTDLFRAAKKAFLKSSCLGGHIGSSCAKVRRMILTPTRMVFFEPDIMQTNRVLRKYKPEHFIRVSIRDENFDKLTAMNGDIGDLLARVAGVLRRGFRIGSTLDYEYLAGSNSQIREHACYFVEKRAETADSIRKWIGDLQGIRNVASYTSRLGLAFSTSEKAVSVADHLFDSSGEPDVTTGSYNFTDGIGRLSMALADKISDVLLMGHTPSAYQIRFGGAKGVVVIDEALHLDHPGKELVLRKSMIKYPSQHKDIEVLGASRPIRLTLNQQITMLLSNIGIKDNIFLDLLKTHLASLSEMFVDEKLARRRMANVASVNSRMLEEADICITSEPYMRSLLTAVYRCQLKTLLERSRVPIDDSNARVLIGVVDDTKTLRYGQVFVQFSDNCNEVAALNSEHKSTILERRVVIAKNPCLHPGDVRTFTAVDVPALHHMYDCVVFPCVGPRPHPNELSGSDLDGDLYHGEARMARCLAVATTAGMHRNHRSRNHGTDARSCMNEEQTGKSNLIRFNTHVC
eukprot:evm.model.scf_108.3 EVM.evm.TU.scf_108.3   scf_108:8471-14081(-)